MLTPHARAPALAAHASASCAPYSGSVSASQVAPNESFAVGAQVQIVPAGISLTAADSMVLAGSSNDTTVAWAGEHGETIPTATVAFDNSSNLIITVSVKLASSGSLALPL